MPAPGSPPPRKHTHKKSVWVRRVVRVPQIVPITPMRITFSLTSQYPCLRRLEVSTAVLCHDQQLYQVKVQDSKRHQHPPGFQVVNKPKILSSASTLIYPFSSQILRCVSCERKEHEAFLLLPHKSARQTEGRNPLKPLTSQLGCC